MISILQNAENGSVTGEEPVILLADDLAPSETVQLDKSKVLSFVTRHGSTNSHTAILARTMNIPALIFLRMSMGKWVSWTAIPERFTLNRMRRP